MFLYSFQFAIHSRWSHNICGQLVTQFICNSYNNIIHHEGRKEGREREGQREREEERM